MLLQLADPHTKHYAYDDVNIYVPDVAYFLYLLVHHAQLDSLDICLIHCLLAKTRLFRCTIVRKRGGGTFQKISLERENLEISQRIHRIHQNILQLCEHIFKFCESSFNLSLGDIYLFQDLCQTYVQTLPRHRFVKEMGGGGVLNCSGRYVLLCICIYNLSKLMYF